MSFSDTSVTGQSDYITRLSDLSPIVGDSTAYGALVFTPILYRNATPEPQYPGYVLPGAELDLPNWDVISNQVINNTNDSVFEHADFPFARLDPMTMVFQTDLSPIAMGLGNSFLQLLASQANWYNASIDHSKADTSVLWQFKNGSRLNGVQWMSIGGEEGFRYWDAWMYLKPNTNYTAWAIAWDGTVSVTSRPVFFMSKSGECAVCCCCEDSTDRSTDDFPCSLLPPSDICPGVSYAVPFPNDTDTMITSIPNDLRSSITASLDAFSLSVTGSGIACGRDMYSYVSTCLDCVNAYRDWLCHTLLPRCADANPQPFTNMPNGKYVPSQPITAQRTSSDPRNNATEVSSPPMDYNELLPCIGLCTAVERKCPPGLAWNCPHRSFNADKSYAYIGKNNLHGDGSANTGYPAQDQYGNVWCNDGSSM